MVGRILTHKTNLISGGVDRNESFANGKEHFLVGKGFDVDTMVVSLNGQSMLKLCGRKRPVYAGDPS